MARFFGADILTTLQTYLTAEIPVMLETIRLERSDSEIEDVKAVNIGYSERQYPECLISMDDSEVEVDHLSMDIQDTPEIYPLDVIILLKDITKKTYLYQEYYIECLERILHGYTDSDITWIVVNNAIRTNMYTEQKEMLRVVGVSISVRIL